MSVKKIFILFFLSILFTGSVFWFYAQAMPDLFNGSSSTARMSSSPLGGMGETQCASTGTGSSTTYYFCGYTTQCYLSQGSHMCCAGKVCPHSNNITIGWDNSFSSGTGEGVCCSSSDTCGTDSAGKAICVSAQITPSTNITSTDDTTCDNGKWIETTRGRKCCGKPAVVCGITSGLQECCSADTRCYYHTLNDGRVKGDCCLTSPCGLVPFQICCNSAKGEVCYGGNSLIRASCRCPEYSCAGKTCGADDNCGGKCDGSCPRGQQCSAVQGYKCIDLPETSDCKKPKYICGLKGCCTLEEECLSGKCVPDKTPDASKPADSSQTDKPAERPAENTPSSSTNTDSSGTGTFTPDDSTISVEDKKPENENPSGGYLSMSSEKLKTKCEARPKAAVVAQKVYFGAAAEGGREPYSYEWTAMGTKKLTNAKKQILSGSFDKPGVYTAYATVTSADGKTGTCEASVEISEELPFEAKCYVEAGHQQFPMENGKMSVFPDDYNKKTGSYKVYKGESVSLLVEATGGKSPGKYNYTWRQGLTSGELSAKGNLPCDPSKPLCGVTILKVGPLQAKISVTSGDDKDNVTVATCKMYAVNPAPLSAKAKVGPNPVAVGQRATFEAYDVTGGTGEYFYKWEIVVDGKAVGYSGRGESGRVWQPVAQTPGKYTAFLTVYSPGVKSVTRSVPVEVVVKDAKISDGGNNTSASNNAGDGSTAPDSGTNANSSADNGADDNVPGNVADNTPAKPSYDSTKSPDYILRGKTPETSKTPTNPPEEELTSARIDLYLDPMFVESTKRERFFTPVEPIDPYNDLVCVLQVPKSVPKKDITMKLYATTKGSDTPVEINSALSSDILYNSSAGNGKYQTYTWAVKGWNGGTMPSIAGNEEALNVLKNGAMNIFCRTDLTIDGKSVVLSSRPKPLTLCVQMWGGEGLNKEEGANSYNISAVADASVNVLEKIKNVQSAVQDAAPFSGYKYNFGYFADLKPQAYTTNTESFNSNRSVKCKGMDLFYNYQANGDENLVSGGKIGPKTELLPMTSKFVSGTYKIAYLGQNPTDGTLLHNLGHFFGLTDEYDWKNPGVLSPRGPNCAFAQTPGGLEGIASYSAGITPFTSFEMLYYNYKEYVNIYKDVNVSGPGPVISSTKEPKFSAYRGCRGTNDYYRSSKTSAMRSASVKKFNGLSCAVILSEIEKNLITDNFARCSDMDGIINAESNN